MRYPYHFLVFSSNLILLSTFHRHYQQQDRYRDIMPSYHRVASNESDHENADSNSSSDNSFPHHHRSASATTTTSQRRTLAERFSDKLIAAAWVAVAVVVAYFTSTWHVLTASDSPANHVLLQLTAVCVGINTVLFLYLLLYLPYIKGLTDSSAWDVYCPRVIPTATAVGVLCGLLLIRATWPVWGFLSPLVLGIEGLGVLYSLHFVPWPF